MINSGKSIRKLFFPLSICTVAYGSSWNIALQPAQADEFNCFQAEGCSAPALSNSNQCLEGRDYTIHTQMASDRDVLVMSIHGGRIELRTSDIARSLVDRYNWSLYDFTANARGECLNGLDNYQRLHITSTNFDEPRALALVGTHQKSVSIHGYGTRRGYSEGVICVGGKEDHQRKRFIDYLNARRESFTLYTLQPLDATLAEDGGTCDGLEGVLSSNIVNRNSRGMGLQLEFSRVLREGLVSSGADFDALRDLVYGAIAHAMDEPMRKVKD